MVDTDEPRLELDELRATAHWVGGGEASPERQAALHREVARRVQEGGRFWISTTVLEGRAHFRINPLNFRTRTAHMDALLGELRASCLAVGRELAAGAAEA